MRVHSIYWHNGQFLTSRPVFYDSANVVQPNTAVGKLSQRSAENTEIDDNTDNYFSLKPQNIKYRQIPSTFKNVGLYCPALL